jgi:metal transporter CNNM
MSIEIITWIGILFCLSQSGIFSGLNLALFGIGRLRLEVEASIGNPKAEKVLKLREDFNYTLTTILWGNVAANTLLAILANSVMAGLIAFLFSTFFITFFGEILPQAYFSRHALKMASLLSPLFKFYQVLLYPLAKPSSKILDWWLGMEGALFFSENAFREVIKKHIESSETDVDKIEGIGALNFLVFDDLPIVEEGETIDPNSIIQMPSSDNKPAFPDISNSSEDAFLRKINLSYKRWVIITNENNHPYMVIDADGFLRNALFHYKTFDPFDYCHYPIIVEDIETPLGKVIWRFKVEPEHSSDDVIDKDIIILWGSERRIITGADILGRLLHGIVDRLPISPHAKDST